VVGRDLAAGVVLEGSLCVMVDDDPVSTVDELELSFAVSCRLEFTRKEDYTDIQL
jgi:hypothetical protein